MTEEQQLVGAIRDEIKKMPIRAQVQKAYLIVRGMAVDFGEEEVAMAVCLRGAELQALGTGLLPSEISVGDFGQDGYPDVLA